jgi:energy-coupling factor transporter ATP-binding protein EcfA2
MIEAHNLVKRYGSTMAVNDLSFSVRPGMVTGFLGPNGAGKTTTMRMILGLDVPTRGSVTVGGRNYRDLYLTAPAVLSVARGPCSGTRPAPSPGRCWTAGTHDGGQGASPYPGPRPRCRQRLDTTRPMRYLQIDHPPSGRN